MQEQNVGQKLRNDFRSSGIHHGLSFKSVGQSHLIPDPEFRPIFAVTDLPGGLERLCLLFFQFAFPFHSQFPRIRKSRFYHAQ